MAFRRDDDGDIQGQLRRRMRLDEPTFYDDQPAPAQEPDVPAAPAAPAAPAPAPTGAPIQSTPAAPAAPAAPQISSGYGASDPRRTEDLWFQFLNSSGLATGQAGNGFYAGGGAYRGNLGDVVNRFNQATGSSARAVSGHDDQIDFGRGAQDVLQAGTNNWWLSPSSGPSSPAGGGAAASTGAGGGAGAGAGAAGAVSPFQQQIRDLLMQQLGQLSRPVTADDPSIKGQMDAQSALAERVRQERRAAAAERAAADGLLNGGQGSGAFEADVASGYEDKGQKLSGLQADLFSREIQSRRDKVAQLLALATQSGDAESARALQLQIAQMDDVLRRMGLEQQGRQFDDQFGLSASQALYNRDRDLALFGAGS